jgi:hypothetical protein
VFVSGATRPNRLAFSGRNCWNIEAPRRPGDPQHRAGRRNHQTFMTRSAGLLTASHARSIGRVVGARMPTDAVRSPLLCCSGHPGGANRRRRSYALISGDYGVSSTDRGGLKDRDGSRPAAAKRAIKGMPRLGGWRSR